MDVTVRQVLVENLGSGLVANAAIGAATLTVADPTDFEENGATLDLGGIEYTYSKADMQTGVITLATTLTVAALVDDPVLTLTATGGIAQEWTLEYESADGAEPDMAIIPQEMIPYFVPGDDLAGALATVESDGRGGNVVTSTTTTTERTARTGVQTITTGASGTVTGVTVFFPVPFATGIVPRMFASVVTSRPDINFATPGNANNKSFTLYLTRTDVSATLDVNWHARTPE